MMASVEAESTLIDRPLVAISIAKGRTNLASKSTQKQLILPEDFSLWLAHTYYVFGILYDLHINLHKIALYAKLSTMCMQAIDQQDYYDLIWQVPR